MQHGALRESDSPLEVPAATSARTVSVSGPPHSRAVGACLVVGWTLFRLAIWATTTTLVAPHLLTHVGLDATAAWLQGLGGMRWVAAPVLLPFLLLSACNPHVVRPGSPEESEYFAGSPGIDPELGVRQGAPLAWRLEGHVVEAATWYRRRERRCVANVMVSVPTGVSLLVRSARNEPAFLRAANQGVLEMAVEHGRRPERSAEAIAWEGVDFLARDPMNLRGHPLDGVAVLRTNQPARVREWLDDPEVMRAFAELEQDCTKWELTLLPERAPTARLRFQCRGRADHPGIAARGQALMRTVLRTFAEPVPIARGLEPDR